MSRYFLGVDVGATKSHAMITDETGRVLGMGLGGPGNHETVGWEGTVGTLNSVVRDAVADAGISLSQIAGAGFGLAGFDWESERAEHMAAVATIGLECPIELVNDAIIGLVAGAEAGWGVALVAGTGNNCRGWDRHHREGKLTGCGWQFAENGGSGETVLKAVQEVSRAWSKRGPETLLTQYFIERTGALDEEDLIEGLSQGGYSLRSEAAPLIFAAAEAGDEVAAGVIRWAGEELGSSVLGVVRQIDLQDEEFEVVMVGSLFKGGARLIDPLRETVHAVAPGARFVRLEAPPVVGAVLLGMEVGGGDPRGVRGALIASAEAFATRVVA